MTHPGTRAPYRVPGAALPQAARRAPRERTATGWSSPTEPGRTARSAGRRTDGPRARAEQRAATATRRAALRRRRWHGTRSGPRRTAALWGHQPRQARPDRERTDARCQHRWRGTPRGRSRAAALRGHRPHGARPDQAAALPRHQPPGARPDQAAYLNRRPLYREARSQGGAGPHRATAWRRHRPLRSRSDRERAAARRRHRSHGTRRGRGRGAGSWRYRARGSPCGRGWGAGRRGRRLFAAVLWGGAAVPGRCGAGGVAGVRVVGWLRRPAGPGGGAGSPGGRCAEVGWESPPDPAAYPPFPRSVGRDPPWAVPWGAKGRSSTRCLPWGHAVPSSDAAGQRDGPRPRPDRRPRAA